ncbi:MAG: hypothetical protein ACK4SZ_13800 [Allosphingosinicella sp.]|uniref:hypothetical protein n=1 Tax=Allosphingosinicella sp. TaxID=2823234 RepID=UPI003925AAB2
MSVASGREFAESRGKELPGGNHQVNMRKARLRRAGRHMHRGDDRDTVVLDQLTSEAPAEVPGLVEAHASLVHLRKSQRHDDDEVANGTEALAIIGLGEPLRIPKFVAGAVGQLHVELMAGRVRPRQSQILRPHDREGALSDELLGGESGVPAGLGDAKGDMLHFARDRLIIQTRRGF